VRIFGVYDETKRVFEVNYERSSPSKRLMWCPSLGLYYVRILIPTECFLFSRESSHVKENTRFQVALINTVPSWVNPVRSSSRG